MHQPDNAVHGRYAAHWGLTDLYPEHEQALDAALRGRQPFDTGVFGAKKEIEFARIQRLQENAPVWLVVRCEADDGMALADTAFWEAAGSNDHCYSGEDALRKLGLKVKQVVEELGALASAADIGQVNDAERTRELPAEAGIPEVLEAIEALTEEAYQELALRLERMINLARLRLATLAPPSPPQG